MLWKTNLAGNVDEIDNIQIHQENIVIALSLSNGDTSEKHYMVLNKEDGSVLVDAVSMS